MARYKPYQYDQMVMVPILFLAQLEPGTLKDSIHVLVEHHLDLAVFEARYQNDRTGARAIHPKLLLKVILFAYSRGVISSQQIERACSENMLFMALSDGCRPNHSTLAHFVSFMRKEIESIFANLRTQKRLDHFTLRSKAKVDVQWKLFALVHNIGKIHRYGQVP